MSVSGLSSADGGVSVMNDRLRAPTAERARGSREQARNADGPRLQPGGAGTQTVHGVDQHVAFTTTDQPPGPGEAHVYRVAASQGGTVFGGYTVVLLG